MCKNIAHKFKIKNDHFFKRIFEREREKKYFEQRDPIQVDFLCQC